MDAAIPALITSVGAVIVAIISRPRDESRTARLRLPEAWVSALCVVLGLYMVALTMVLDATYPIVFAWIGATLMSAILLAAATPLASARFFSGGVVFLLLFTLTLLHRNGPAPLFFRGDDCLDVQTRGGRRKIIIYKRCCFG